MWILLGEGVRSHQHFLPETRWFGDLQKRRWGLCPPLLLISWKQSFHFFFGYWSCFCLLPVCTKLQTNAPQLPQSFSQLFWSTFAFNRCSRMPVCSHSCLPAEEAGAVQSWMQYRKEEYFTGVNGKWEGKMVCVWGNITLLWGSCQIPSVCYATWGMCTV